jgi:outer membrane autotransporter protein
VKTRPTLRLRPLNAALVLTGLLMAPGTSTAQSTDWNGGGAGDWNTGGNWTSGVPNAGTNARLTNSTDQPTLNGAGAALALEIQGVGEVIVGAGGSLAVTDIINLGTVGGAGVAKLTIQGGGTVSAAHLFAGDAPRQGIVTVTGAGSTLTLAPIGVGQADRFEIGGNGAGELHIDAGANVTVNGTRTLHVGDTANGTLYIGSGAGAGTLTADSVILGTVGSSVQFNHAGTTTFSAAVSGNGFLTKAGGGTTILTGANTYTGGTTVGAGLLQGDTTSLQRNITNNAAVSFNQVANGTYAGTMSGTGILAKTGAGILVLTGPNNYSGGTTVTNGTLQGDTTSLQGNITNNAAVIFNQAADGTYAGAMSGGGSLTKAATGTLTLTGTNTFNGGLTVNAGAIAASTASALGTGDIILSGGQLTGTANMTVANTILRVSGGATGTVAAAPGTVLTINSFLNMASLATLRVGDAGNNGVVDLNASGGGVNVNNNLVVAGGTLRAGNSLLGSVTGSIATTTIDAGATLDFNGQPTVSAAVKNLQGAGTLTNNGSVVVVSSGAFSGSASGTMGLIKQGAGTLAFTGTNSYSGGTTVSGGTLLGNTAGLQGIIVNDALVTFDQAAAGTYAGIMSGTGALTKQGAGNLLLSGTNTYNGATSINAGTLSVNGSIANSAVTVNNGGTLGGSGMVGTTTIAAGGVLAPGNSIGTLTVNGNVTFAAGSTYRVEVDPAGSNDRINATGTATINGGTVDVQAGAGTYAASTQYTILNAAGGRTGNFAGVTSNLAFLTPTLGYNANNVFLTLARNDVSFASVAITPNQIAASTALQNAGNAGDMGTVQTALTGLSAVQARAAYDASGGAGIVELRRASADFAANFGSRLQARLGAAQNRGEGSLANSFTGRPVLLAANDHLSDLMAPASDAPSQKFSLAGNTPALTATSDAGRGLWVRGFGGHGRTDGDGNAAASRLRSSGLSIGVDAEVQDGLRVGAAVTTGTSRLSTDNNESGKTRDTAVAVYGGYVTGPWTFSGSASMGWGKNHMDRSVAVGALTRLASSDFDSSTLSAYGEASYSIAMNGWTLQPLAGLSLSRNKADGFTESGAGALNLQVAEQSVNSSRSMLGAKAFFDAGRIRFEPRVVWAHEFGDLNTPMTVQFQGAATASPFQISGATLKRDTLILGISATGSLSKGVDLFADVQAEHNSAQRNLAVLIGLRSRW